MQSLSSSVGRAQGWKLWGRWFEPNLRQQMNKLLVSYFLKNIPHLFIKNPNIGSGNTLIVLPDYLLYYLSLHLKLSTQTKDCQLIEIFGYETTCSNSKKQNISGNNFNSTLAVYQFHNLFSQERIFILTTPIFEDKSWTIQSIAELYSTAWWLERELSEMHGICFAAKKDLRNLMLQYGDSTAPLRKLYPSVGHQELAFDPINDNVVQIPVSVQV